MSTEGRWSDPVAVTIQPACEDIYTIHICQSFTKGLKDENETIGSSSREETYLRVDWKNNGLETAHSKWTVEFENSHLKKSTILKKLSENLLESLRETVIEAFHSKFKCRLEFVGFQENLVFGFIHDDEQSENAMVENGNVEEVLMTLFAPVKIAKTIHVHDERKDDLKDQKGGKDKTEVTPQNDSVHKDTRTMENLFKEAKKENVSGKSQRKAFVTKSQSAVKMDKDTDSALGAKLDGKDAIVQKNYNKAESMLHNLHVCGSASEVHPLRTERLIEKVALALEQEDPPPYKGKGLDTVLCIDVSDSIGEQHLHTLKETVKGFIEGLEDTAINEELEENVAVVVMGEDTRVIKQLTNDYNRLCTVVDSITAGGRSPIMEALLICIAAIKEKGGTIVAMNHQILPRIIFFTDGRCTSDELLTGSDSLVSDSRSKTEIIRLVTSILGSERDIAPLTWVPVGDNPDMHFMNSLAKLGFGKVVELKDIHTLKDHYRIQMTTAHVHLAMTNSGLMAIDDLTRALAGELDAEYHSTIVDAVRKKMDYVDVPDPDGRPCDYNNVHEVSGILPLGTRVVRGPDWMFGEQDLWGPGTVVNHANDKGRLWVHWDYTSSNCRYRYEFQGKKDVKETDLPRSLNKDEFMEIGIQVERGPDWSGTETDGGAGKKGIVIRKNSAGMVKVKWLTNQVIEEYKYGCNGLFEVAVSDVECVSEPVKSSVVNQTTLSSKDGGSSDSHAQAEWKWKDEYGCWQPFGEVASEKIERDYKKEAISSLVENMNNYGNVRIIFSKMSVRSSDGNYTFDVQRV